ncbi:MAG: GNAT family N-acetyltransferase [Bacteroidota bacterium]
MDIEFKIIEFNNEAFNQMLEIRSKVLREPLGLRYTNEQLAAEINFIHIVILVKQKIVGGLQLVEEGNNKIKVRQVAIDPSYQSMGLGKELMLYAEDFARKKAYTYIYCHARNTALSFYTKLDYQIKGEEFQEVGIPHHYMFKYL